MAESHPVVGASPRAVVIGAGVGGLAAAIRLRLAGYGVTVLESAAVPGGKLGEHREAGFRFDRGPSLFTLPHLLDELFREAGADPQQYYRYYPLDPVCRYHFAGGAVLSAWADPDRFAEECQRVLGEPADHIQKQLRHAGRIFELTEELFLQSSLHRWDTYRRAPWRKMLQALPDLDLFRSMHRSNQSRLRSPEMVQLFDRYATYNGSNPYKAPATLNVIGHLEHQTGAYFPVGGMRRLVEALYRLAVERGVQFHFNTTAGRIVVAESQQGGKAAKRVTGVRTNSTAEPVLSAEVVISNMDIVPTYRKLLPDIAPPERTLRQPKSSSALIFYWGMDRQFPELEVHNIFFSQDYEKEFRMLSERHTLHDDLTVYLYISSKAAPDDAPEGGENWFVMVNAPHLTRDDGAGRNVQDWESMVAQARSNILRRLAKQLGVALEPHIRCEQVLDPRGIEAQTSSWLGALYGNSSDNRMAAFLRHPNFSRQVSGLYFCGGSVHPGGGIPLCLLSAKIAVEDLRRYGPERI